MENGSRRGGLALAVLLLSTRAFAIGTAGAPCTVADYQAANACLNGTFGTIAGALGQCNLACNDLGTGQPPGTTSGEIWSGAGQGAGATVVAIGTVLKQQGNEILQCVTQGAVEHCVPVAIIVGGTICAVATAGACVPVMAGGAAIAGLGNCAYQCLGTSDPDACQQACAGSIITTVGGAVATGVTYGPQLNLPVSQVQWIPKPAMPVPTTPTAEPPPAGPPGPVPAPPPAGTPPPPVEPFPTLPPVSGGAPALTPAEAAALEAGIKDVFAGNGTAIGSALGELGAAEFLVDWLAQKYPGIPFYEALWQHMIETPCSRNWCPRPNPIPPAPKVP
jgi:hypothetical protein